MKVCPYCAEELADDVAICTQCGKDATQAPGRSVEAPVPVPRSAEQIVRASEARSAEPHAGTNRLAIASFFVVMGIGILGSATSLPPAAGVVGFATGLGLAFAAIGRGRSLPGGRGGTGFAVAAAVLAVVGLIGHGRLLID